jgi:hypothetical protein
MAITAVSNSMENSMAGVATDMQGGRIQEKIGFAILKQIMDSQKMQGELILKMIDSGPKPTVDGTGSIVNIGA